MDVTELPFDQYQRYRLVADILEQVRPAGQRLRVLDVGGRTAILRGFLPEDRVELVDVEASDQPGLVLGDGSRLPFQDGAFDAAVTFDTLEHVPPARREAFVRECRRVARRWVVITGPYRAPEVEHAERLLRGFLTEKLHQSHRYLEEHHANGLPGRGEVEDLLRELGGRVTSIGHGNLDRWLPLMCFSLYLDRDAPLRPLARDLFRFYNRSFYASDHAEPVYRHAVVAAFGGSALPDAAALLPDGPAPAAALAPLEHVAGELLRFDAQRDVVSAEWARLEAAHRGLEADLAGHRRTIEALRAELAAVQEEEARLGGELARERRQGEEARAALAADLAAHVRTVEDHRAELAELRESRDQERREGEAARDALAADLEGHRGKLGELGAELAAALAELERLRGELAGEREQSAEAIAALRLDLEGHRIALAGLEGELASQLERFDADRRAHEGAAAALRGELAAHGAVQAELRGELEAHRAVQGELSAELARTQEAARSIQEDLFRTQDELARERELVAVLRADLRDRWKSLKRAFAWRKATP